MKRLKVKVRILITAFVCLFLPRRAKPLLLRWLGHPVASTASIGFSVVLVRRLCMGPGARIGQFNLIKIGRLVLNEGTRIGNFNVIHGNFGVRTGARCLLGNRNLINGDATDEPTVLWLGDVSGITAGHYVNVNRSVRIGNFTTVAGAGSQIWTHGFIHMSEGIDRAEVRGKVTLGNNVYVGSHSCLNPGITIGNAVSVGAHSSISTNLLKPGLYVSQALRYIAAMPEDRMAKLLRFEDAEGRVFYERRPVDESASNTGN